MISHKRDMKCPVFWGHILSPHETVLRRNCFAYTTRHILIRYHNKRHNDSIWSSYLTIDVCCSLAYYPTLSFSRYTRSCTYSHNTSLLLDQFKCLCVDCAFDSFACKCLFFFSVVFFFSKPFTKLYQIAETCVCTFIYSKDLVYSWLYTWN